MPTDKRVDVDTPCSCNDKEPCCYHADNAFDLVKEVRRLREGVLEERDEEG